MATKRISATQAKNNFGSVLDDVIRNRTRYLIERHSVPQAFLLSFEDLVHMLSDEEARKQMASLAQQLLPEYRLGQVLSPTTTKQE